MNGKGSRNRSISKKFHSNYDQAFGKKRNSGDGQPSVKKEKPSNFLIKATEAVSRNQDRQMEEIAKLVKQDTETRHK